MRDCLAPLSVPYYLLPGNHDDATQMRAAFPEHTYLGESGFVQYTVQLGPVRLITLDTTVARQSHGALCAKRLAWLEDTLNDSKDMPVVIAMHHPPFKTLIGHMDQIGLLQGAAELETLVAKYSNIERVICGHLHRAIDVRFGATIASRSTLGTPTVASSPTKCPAAPSKGLTPFMTAANSSINLKRHRLPFSHRNNFDRATLHRRLKFSQRAGCQRI